MWYPVCRLSAVAQQQHCKSHHLLLTAEDHLADGALANSGKAAGIVCACTQLNHDRYEVERYLLHHSTIGIRLSGIFFITPR